jgi:hypothetical protein
MSRDIHPIEPAPGGTVPVGAAPYQPPRRRARRLAAAVAAGLALTAGGVAVAQLPVLDHHVGSVFSATQGPDDDTTVPEPERQAPARVDLGHEGGEGGESD